VYTFLAGDVIKPSVVLKNIKIHKLNYAGCLYGCETWSVTLREEYGMRVLEDTVLRKLPGGKRDVATGEWRRLHSGELHDLHSPQNIVRVIKSRRWLGHVAQLWERRGTCRVLV
jgi:hypothetical protein